jgi:glycine/D-amino acid oxidase-like deaminating enzyme
VRRNQECELPDVIIIGGGIAGCATAWYLAADGVDVLLLEQDHLNASASGANAGSLHAQIQHEPFVELGEAWAKSFAPALPFFAASIALWKSAGAEIGADLGVVQCGGILVAKSEDEMRLIEAKSRIETAAGLEMELLNRADLQARAPYVARDMIGGVYCPVEGKADPLTAAPAFAAAAESRGAVIRRGCRVELLRRCDAGYEVVTSEATFTAPRVVNAAGVETGRVAAMVGVSLPIQAFPIQLSVTEPAVALVDHLVYAARDMLTLKQTSIGTILIGGGWPAAIDDLGRPQVSPESLSRNLAVALDVVPALANINIVRTWAAIVNGTTEWRPILGEVPGAPGFYINYVPWMGFTGGPGGARVVASLVQGKPPPLDIDVSYFSP